MIFPTPDTEYWNNKFAAFMHDPFDKVFEIPGHETRAAKLFESFGLDMPNEKFWKTADAMAAGFERGQVPSYSADKNKNGAVNFLENPFLTHPVSNTGGIKIEFPEKLKMLPSEKRARAIYENMLTSIKSYIGQHDDQSGYSGKFKGDPDTFAKARFFYTHLRLRFDLAEDNVSSLGGFWHRIPADSRFPDHSIWQHNALCSAFYSCMELAGSKDDIGMMVFGITPVQAFISKAKKLRDFWTGSVVLSWLAFEGIRWICENLGPDHILYPSLIDQPLIDEYIESVWKMDSISKASDAKDIASLPNKFLFLIPQSQADAIGQGIKEHIRQEWIKLCCSSEKIIEQILKLESKSEIEHIQSMFERQSHDYWNFDWTSVKLLSGEQESKNEMKKFIPEILYANQSGLLDIFNEIIQDKQYYDKSGKGIFYSVTHSMVQSVLAASKTVKTTKRKEENGEKCHMCGEFEILHPIDDCSSIGASEYKDRSDAFWKDFKTKWKREADFGSKPDKLCSICFMKRVIYRVFEKSQSERNRHLLYNMFHKKDSFPSTTEISLFDYYKRCDIKDPAERKKYAQNLYENSDDTLDNGRNKDLTDKDKYYAILMMDGDKMGKLVNGCTLASTWQSVLHPDIFQRLNNDSFDPKYKNSWTKIFNEYPKRRRLLTPAIHAAISESLGDFAIYGVASIIKKYHGRLIYAGGDDVCAVLPCSTALDAAIKIKKYYNSAFQIIKADGTTEQIEKNWTMEKGKLSINLGKGEGISISAGILICHHKENLSLMIERAHNLLNDKAKDRAQRNACAIELKKRSGGSRYFVRKWDDNVWESFATIGTATGGIVKDIEAVSRSVVYRLESFRDGVEAIISSEKNINNTLLIDFIKKQLERSSVGKSVKDEFAGKIADIVIEKHDNESPLFKPEGLIVGAFLFGGKIK